MGELKALVFDLDDTLYPEEAYVRSSFRAVARYLAAEADFSESQAFDFLWGEHAASRRGRIFDALLEQHPELASQQVTDLVALYREHRPELALYPGMKEVLDDAQARGLQLALISDGPLVSQQRKVEALGLTRWFDPILLTDAWGRAFWKPHPRAFLAVQGALGCAGGELAYLADNPAKDFLAPRQLGWETVRLRLPGQLKEFDEAPAAEYAPDLELQSLEALGRWVEDAQRPDRGTAPRVSILVPVYNTRGYLDDCLTSCSRQTYANLEIIAVDDGSTDGSWDLLRAHASRDPRIVALRQENGGVTAARNRALAASSGLFVTYLDGDDHLPEHAVTRLLEVALAEEADIVCGDHELWTDGVPLGIVKRGNFAPCDGPTYAAWALEQRKWSLWEKLFKKSLLGPLPIPREVVHGEDTLTLLQIALRASRVVKLDATVYHYVRRPGSVTTALTFPERNEFHHLQIMYRIWQNLAREHPLAKPAWEAALGACMGYLADQARGTGDHATVRDMLRCLVGDQGTPLVHTPQTRNVVRMGRVALASTWAFHAIRTLLRCRDWVARGWGGSRRSHRT